MEEDPELHKAAKLATLLHELWNTVTKSKDENNELLCIPFLTMPSKRKVPEYYTRVVDPIDLSVIEQNIANGVYKTPDSFNTDMNLLFSNAIKYYGRTSENGIAATRLKKIYVECKKLYVAKFEDTLGEKPSSNFVSSETKGKFMISDTLH